MPGDYFKNWYEKNKGDVAKRRKERYDNDPEYRDKVLRRSANYRERQRDVVTARVPRNQQLRTLTLDNGEEVTLYPIGDFAAFVGRSVQTLNHWISSGIIPNTPYVYGERKFRFYTREMMEVVKRAVGDKRRLFPVDESMIKEIKDAWDNLGVSDVNVDVTNAMVRVPRSQRPKFFRLKDGNEVAMFSIGAFSFIVDRSIQTLNQWEQTGLIPRTPYVQGTRRYRYYTFEMMEAVRRAVGNKRRLYPVDEGMKEAIRLSWKELGVPIGFEGDIEEALERSEFKPLPDEGILSTG